MGDIPSQENMIEEYESAIKSMLPKGYFDILHPDVKDFEKVIYELGIRGTQGIKGRLTPLEIVEEIDSLNHNSPDIQKHNPQYDLSTQTLLLTPVSNSKLDLKVKQEIEQIQQDEKIKMESPFLSLNPKTLVFKISFEDSKGQVKEFPLNIDIKNI